MVELRRWIGRLAACFIFASLSAGVNDSAARDSGERMTAHDLATITDIEGLSISPDGRWAAFQTRRGDPETNTYEQAWYVAPTKDGAPRRVADGGEAMRYANASPRTVHGQIVVPPPVWSPDSKWMIYVRQEAGRTQLWRTRVDGRRTEQLTHNEADMHGFNPRGPDGRVASGFRISRDGGRLFFETRISEAQLNAALLSEGRTGFLFDDRFVPPHATHPLAPANAALKHLGSYVSLTHGETATTSLWVHDFSTQTERLASEAEAKEYAALAAPPDPPTGRETIRGALIESPSGGLAWAEARDPDLQGELPPKTIVGQLAGAAAPAVCEADICTGQFVSPLLWRNDQEVLFSNFSSDRLDERALYAWRPGENMPPRIVLRTQGLYEGDFWDCAVAQDRLVCLFEEPDRPRRLVAINLDTGMTETIYDPNPHWENFDLGPRPKIINVRLPSGAHLPSYLVLPPSYRGGERLPLVIVTYTCAGFLRGGVGDEYPLFPLAAAGFAVLCHNHLGIELEAAKQVSAAEMRREQYAVGNPFQRRIQAGLDAVVADLDQLGIIDSERVGITGLSMGSQTVKYALFNMPSLSAAIASGAEAESAVFSLGTPLIRRSYRQQFGIDSQFSPRLESLSLARNADKVRAPFLINASDHEMLVSLETVAALQDAGRAVEMYVFADEYHIKWQPAHRLAIYNRNIDWMNFWLRGVESNLSNNPDQYVRWRAMRDNQCRLFTGADTPWYCRQ